MLQARCKCYGKTKHSQSILCFYFLNIFPTSPEHVPAIYRYTGKFTSLEPHPSVHLPAKPSGGSEDGGGGAVKTGGLGLLCSRRGGGGGGARMEVLGGGGVDRHSVKKGQYSIRRCDSFYCNFFLASLQWNLTQICYQKRNVRNVRFVNFFSSFLNCVRGGRNVEKSPVSGRFLVG